MSAWESGTIRPPVRDLRLLLIPASTAYFMTRMVPVKGDSRKTKAQLLEELEALRSRVAEIKLEPAAPAQLRQTAPTHDKLRLGFPGAALHSCSASPAVEPGEGQMGNVGLGKWDNPAARQGLAAVADSGQHSLFHDTDGSGER